MSLTPSLPDAPGPSKRWQCWECQRRRLVCDSQRPVCNKCKTSGITCPGYDDKKPLTWLAPGKVLARNRRKKKNVGNPSSSGDGLVVKGVTQVRPLTLIRMTAPNLPSTTDIARANPVPTRLLRTDLCDMAEAANFYSSYVVPRTVDALLVQDLPPATEFELANLPPLTLHAIVCISLGYRIHTLARGVNTAMVQHLWSRLYHHRGAAIRILNKDISGEATRASNATISGLVVFLVQELQQSIDPNWKYHFEGAMELTKLRGGMLEICSKTPCLKAVLTLLTMIGVFGNTTSPAEGQIAPEPHVDMIDDVAQIFETGGLTPILCPKHIFFTIIHINNLRFQAAKGVLPRNVSRSTAEALLREIESFSATQWAETKDSYLKEWTLLGTIFQTSAALYCICSLQSVAVLPATVTMETIKAGYRARHLELLEEGMNTRRVTQTLLWPLVVAGVVAVGSGASLKTRAFVEDSLVTLSKEIGSFSPRLAVATLAKFWRSGETRWDECFDRPYAFLL